MTIEGTMKKSVVTVNLGGSAEIEETPRNHPQKIFSLPVDVLKGLRIYGARLLAKKLG